VTLRFRTANEADLDRLVDIHLVAYPDDRDGAARKRNFTANVFGGLDDVVVVEDEARLVGHARLFRMKSWFGGRPVKVGGIASVAVAPEARGRGVARALLADLHARSLRRGDAVTMLYAFKQGYYARLGYAATSTRKRLSFDPASLPEAYRALARSMVRGVTGEDRAGVERAYALAAVGQSGWLARSPRLWDRLWSRERRQVLVAARGARSRSRRDRVVGYVAFELLQPEPHGETRLAVEELAADDAEARRALWGALGAMRDQVAEVDVEVAADDPIEHALEDGDRRRYGTHAVEHGLGEVVVGPMIRVGAPARAIAARGYGAAGAFNLEVDGARFGVRVSADGKAELGRPGRARDDVRTTSRGLAALLYGGLPLVGAVALGLAEAAPHVVAKVAPVLALAPVFPVDPF
jgi:predicted acetyltransferase